MLAFIHFLSYVTIMSITPGPNNVICLTQGRKFGIKASIPYTYGVAIGCLSQQWLILYFGKSLGDVLPVATRVVSYFGAAYMVFLAYVIITSKDGIKNAKIKEKPLGIKAGTFLQYANPKAYIFNTTVVSGFILPMALTVYQNMLLSLLTGLIFLLCTGAWVLFGQAFSRLFTKHHKRVSYVLGLTLIYLAASIVLHQ